MSDMRGLLPLGLLVLVAGCAASDAAPSAPASVADTAVPQLAVADAPKVAAAATRPATPALKAFVMHLPGVSGTSMIDYTLIDGLKAGGFDGAFQIYDWTCRDPGIPALHNRARNEAQAAVVADILTRQYRAFPDRPIYLTCHSGGSGPATWALERLPADVKVSCFVMLAPALSPNYDLSKALSRVADKAFCFNSPLDDLVLGTGTKLFGTIDGVRGDAAGRIGFERPASADERQYAKLVIKPYESAWSRYGHVGGHIGCMGMTFVEAIVAPAMLGRTASVRVMNGSAAQPTPDVLWPK
jgi:hypothetical protein